MGGLERRKTGRALVIACCAAALAAAVGLGVLGALALMGTGSGARQGVFETGVTALVGAAMCVVGALLVAPTATHAGAYANRHALAGVGGIVMPTCMLGVAAAALFLVAPAALGVATGATAGAVFLLLPGVVLVLPLPALHPFGAAQDAKGGSPSTRAGTAAPVATSVAHRVGGGIFEDWPEPQPFAAEALYAYQRTSSSELSFRRGDRLVVLDCRGNWWQARHAASGLTGFVPSNYIRVLRRATVRAASAGDAPGGGFVARHPDEVSVAPGDSVEVMEVHEQMSLVRTAATAGGRIGSVPTAILEIHPLAPEDAAVRP